MHGENRTDSLGQTFRDRIGRKVKEVSGMVLEQSEMGNWGDAESGFKHVDFSLSCV